MNEQCHDCKIRKLCYLEEPEEDWTCDHYEPCEYDEEDVTDINVGAKDTISRAKAIEAVQNRQFMLSKEKVLLINDLEKLPPAQPEQLGTNLAEVGTDCISRQAAIDICRAPHMRNADCSDFEMAIMMLPPAQPKLLQPWEVLAAQAVLPQPKMGKWIYHIDDLFPAESTMECNQCHAEQPLTCDDEFCPHCGAKMEVTE
jgi:hypothetical protein